MFFSIALNLSLAIFLIGTAYKVYTWFYYKLGPNATEISTSRRISAAIRGILSTVFSAKILCLIRAFVLDILLQRRTLKEDPLRWVMHLCIYHGFMLLLLMHALGSILTSALFPGYASTVNPFLFLRDLAGALVLLGIAIALYRRFFSGTPRLRTSGMDVYAIAIVAVILVSGIVLEGVKITSHSSYKRMEEEYAGMEDEGLEAYWVKDFGLVSPTVNPPFDVESLEWGKELHADSCAECHARPGWAFLGYSASRMIRPAASALDEADAPRMLWWVHILACFAGLALLPFTKMFHILSSQVSLLAASVMDRETSDPANLVTKQIMELDACTHCGTCSTRCSVAIAFERIPNRNILPSEKIASIKALVSGNGLGEADLRALQEGVFLCTNCERCTVVCPVGISLKDLWFSAREELLAEGYPEFSLLSPLSFYRGLMQSEIDPEAYREPLYRARRAIAAECRDLQEEETLHLTPRDSGFQTSLSLSSQSNTFSACFGCRTCTTACPVVANYEDPKSALKLLPHQIMHACGLGLREMAFGSDMLWDCLTCYQCQEQCPQGVCVTDVLYELKNLAVRNVRDKMGS